MEEKGLLSGFLFDQIEAVTKGEFGGMFSSM